VLILGLMIGGGITAALLRKKQSLQDQGFMPAKWVMQFGPSRLKRLTAAFTGGTRLLFGARLAGGCTSGHMISGISQLEVSLFIFGVVTFAVAILAAKILYRTT
jgi:uncharacterized membrane protein YedE/YeeE